MILRNLSLLVLLPAAVVGSEPASPDWKAIQPMLKAKCYQCHGGEKTKGKVDLVALAADPNFAEEYELWDRVLETIEVEDMPPSNADQLATEEKIAITQWVDAELHTLAEAYSGDPGPITMRRLTNAEYDRTIRDLTGRDYQLAAEFQSEAGGGEGFTNIGDVMFLSPAALNKYFGAARELAEHASILPGTGIAFNEQRIGLRGPEQLKAQAEQGLYVWYQKKSAPHLPKDSDDMREADYMLACWKHQHQKTPLKKLSEEMGLQLPFLQNWWNLLNSTEPKSRFLDLTRLPWKALPGPDVAKPQQIPAAVTQQIARIQADRLLWNDPKNPGKGVQRRQQDADGLRTYTMVSDVTGKAKVHVCIGDLGDGNSGDIALIQSISIRYKKGTKDYFLWLNEESAALRKKLGAKPEPAQVKLLQARLKELSDARAKFGQHPHKDRKIEPQILALAAPQVLTLPVPEGAVQLRAATRLDMKNPAAEEATIQWEMTTGKPRDVNAILPGVLTVWKIRSEKARATMSDFSKMREAFPDMYERRLDTVARNLYRSKPSFSVYYFSDEQLGQTLGEQDRKQLEAMRKDWTFVSRKALNEQQAKDYDAAMIAHLHQFAARAWRRPLSKTDHADLAAFYLDGVNQELDRESAAREVLVRVLVSPHFLFKAETLPAVDSVTLSLTEAGDLPLDAFEVASRLSYFLWASLPDWELRKKAVDGSLLKPEVLAAEAQRMMRDPRSSAMAHEFAGQWLKFREFKDEDSVDLAKYPEMTPAIRADMHREATEYFVRLFREDRKVADVLTGRTTFLNERLAKFYGIPGVTGGEFREVDVAEHSRGGLLGMGAILTETSRPNRTSPVLRGEFLYAVVMGNHSPPPPNDIPPLDESVMKPASLREALMIHREDPACAVCHDRIDPLGFALESYDPIGRLRTGDIDDSGTLKDGTQIDGMPGLRAYLAERSDEFTTHFSEKLLGYALGREVLPSDTRLIEDMQIGLAENDGSVSSLIVDIVTSRQFLNRRPEPNAVATNP